MGESIPAACYIRVSTEDQTEYSPDAQRKALEAYAVQHGMTILPEHIYVDAGISGRKASIRPAFMAMIAAAKRSPPPFGLILVHKLDRFARNREDSIVYKSMLLRQCGVRVISVTEHLEDDKMGLILEAMLEAMAEYYSINLGEEVRKGMAEKARRGELQTSPPFGYRAKENRLVPEPEEAEVVRELYRRFAAGESIHTLTRWAGERGVLSRRGNPLDSRGIRYILENPVYTGKLRWGRDGEGSRILTEGGHTPLVDRALFLSVQDLLAQNASRYGRHARPGGARKHWLAGLVRCAACGGGMIGIENLTERNTQHLATLVESGFYYATEQLFVATQIGYLVTRHADNGTLHLGRRIEYAWLYGKEILHIIPSLNKHRQDAILFVAWLRGHAYSHLVLNHTGATGNQILIVEHLEENLR